MKRDAFTRPEAIDCVRQLRTGNVDGLLEVALKECLPEGSHLFMDPVFKEGLRGGVIFGIMASFGLMPTDVIPEAKSAGQVMWAAMRKHDGNWSRWESLSDSERSALNAAAAELGIQPQEKP